MLATNKTIEAMGLPDTDIGSTQKRLEREAAFHDESYSTNARAQEVDKYYAVAKRSYARYHNELFSGVHGRRALEYGCGINSDAYEIAQRGGTVVGIDISPVAIQMSQELAAEKGIEANTTFLVMNAEELEFPDNSFDIICGIGILHHLDLAKAYSEINRVLKPGGVGVFHEPMGHNPLINRFRNSTPHLRTPDEHPLLRKDIKQARGVFRNVHASYFHLASLGLVPFRNSAIFPALYAITETLDTVLMMLIPPLRSWAWFSVITLQK